jgi:hypothetical protein
VRWVFALAFVACAPQPSSAPASEVAVPAARESAYPADADVPTLGTLGSIVVDSGHTTRTHEPSPEPVASENRQRCDKGDSAGCHAAALDAYYSPPSQSSDRDAREYFTKACDAGYAPSCNGLGLLHHEGRGVKKDDAEAARWYYRSCLDGSSTGCEHLADAFRAGRGVPKNPAAAARALARKKCVFDASLDGGSIASCPGLLGDGGGP